MLILALYFSQRVSFSPSHSLAVFLSVHFTMVTPVNVLVPPIWHFILLYHPVPSAFPSPHTGITLIMIIAVMIMITTAKLHSLSLIFNTQGIMIDWKAAGKCFPRLIFSAKLDHSLLLPWFWFIWLFHAFLALCTHYSLPLQPTSCLFSVFFNFIYNFFHLKWIT